MYYTSRVMLAIYSPHRPSGGSMLEMNRYIEASLLLTLPDILLTSDSLRYWSRPEWPVVSASRRLTSGVI